MSILRTDAQVAAQELLVAVSETADFYAEFAEYVEESALQSELQAIAQQRESYIEPLVAVVRSLHDLPKTPDADQELGKVLWGKLSASLSSSPTTTILEELLQAEDHLVSLIENSRVTELKGQEEGLLNSISEHVSGTADRLRFLLQSNGSSAGD